MSPRTYIGPFGRVLPVPDDREPERTLQIPEGAVDETRTNVNMTTIQLPPPMSLQFGSDTTSGFTEPNRYNTISQSTRTNRPSHPYNRESSRSIHREQLPSVSQLLTPSSQSKVSLPPPYPSQQNPNPSSGPSNFSSHRHRPPSEHIIPATQHPSLPNYPQQIPTQIQSLTTAGPLREEYQINPPFQQFPSPYSHQQGPRMTPFVSSFEPNRQASYHTNPPQVVPPSLSRHQQISPSDSTQLQAMLPLDAAQSQQMVPMNAPSHYFPGSASDHEAIRLDSEHSSPAPSNSVKPLPRVVAERDVPGEGPSWVYEDGTTCKKVIDGEMVNAQWGITKAGKPRKRLAIACTTCREKKIKCDPAEPKCVQCEKFGRECRFTTAFRIQRGSPDSPSYSSQTRTSFIGLKSETPPTPNDITSSLKSPQVENQKVPKGQESWPDTSHIKIEEESFQSNAIPAKRQRSGSPVLLAPKPENKVHTRDSSDRAPEFQCSHLLQVIEPVNVRIQSFDSRNDPFEIDAELSSHYLETYFDHYHNVMYQMFPRKHFLQWARLSERKSSEDLMTVYAMLAVGSTFSSRSDHTNHGSSFCRTAIYAIEASDGQLSLQLVHCRLLLALYYSSAGEPQKFWDYGGMAIRAALGLRLNLDRGCQDGGENGLPLYGLRKSARTECYRRAFWSAYMIDRLSGQSPGQVCMLQSEDAYLRLPCRYLQYEDQEAVEAPYFDNGLIDQRLCEVNEPSELGTMACSVQVCSLWGDILVDIFRSSNRTKASYLVHFETFYKSTIDRLSSWWRSLPSTLNYDALRTSMCPTQTDIGSIMNVHTIYHAAVIKLNRNIRHTFMPDSTISHNIKEALVHAQELLRTVHMVPITSIDTQASHPSACRRWGAKDIAFSTPFLGYAILLAVDVLSAGGSFRSCFEMIRLMEKGLEVFEGLNRFWASARIQSKSIRQRIDKLLETMSCKATGSKRAWKCSQPLDANPHTGHDVFYDAKDVNCKGLLHYLGEKVREHEIIVVD